MEHDIWKPVKKSAKIADQRIAIVGYSHYYETEGDDRVSFTREIVQYFVDGELKAPFFTKIQGYFGFSNPQEFWPNVYFLNFVPEGVGVPGEKYKKATAEQIEAGKERIKRFVSKESVDKMFVFSTEAWKRFPLTLEEDQGKPCLPLTNDVKGPSWGTYNGRKKKVLACGFKHPQYAVGDVMRRDVAKFLAMK